MSQLWVTPGELSDVSTYSRAREACRTASYLLWAMSGRKYSGSSTVTERYLRQRYSPTAIQPVLVNGGVYNRYSDSRYTAGDTVIDYVRLRRRPVLSVHEVISQGRTLDPSEYTLYNQAVLKSGFIDPYDVTVTYTFGANPPSAGRYAARVLAEELVKLWANEPCSLPERVTSVSRQGVSYTFLDNQDFVDSLRTGVYAIDIFLKSVNPDGARKTARIFSPDIPRPHRVTRPVALERHGEWDVTVAASTATTWTKILTEDARNILVNNADWSPSVSVTSLTGAPLFDAVSPAVAVDDSTLTVDITQQQADSVVAAGGGLWDLYAINVAEPSSIIYLLTGNVTVTGA